MSALVFLARAVCLVLLALLLFAGFALALDVELAGSAPEQCMGLPITNCYFTII